MSHPRSLQSDTLKTGVFLCTLLLIALSAPEMHSSDFSYPPSDRPPFDPLEPVPLAFLPWTDDVHGILPSLLTDDTLNIKINSDSVSDIRNEEQVWINPTDEDNLVAVWRDFRLHYRRDGVGYSFDGGRTWTDTLFDKPAYEFQSDPGLTVDSYGNFYTDLLDYSDGLDFNGLFVLKSSDGGVNWNDPVTVVDSVFGAFEDKQLIACDRTLGEKDGNLHVTWARYIGGELWIYCASSLYAGLSFHDPVLVSDNPGNQWPVPAVGADGEIIVAWIGFDPPGIYFDISYDQGQTFGQDSLLTEIAIPYFEINGGILLFSYPAIDVDLTGVPYHGVVYVAYMDVRYGDTDIFFRSSFDGGLTWSEAIRVNDDQIANGADQFHPWLSIDEFGNIVVVFYDRREDLPDNYMMDVFVTVSTDGGATFSPNMKVTTVPSDPRAGQPPVLAGLIGEYIDISAINGKAHVVWTDTRTGHQEVWTATINYPALGIDSPEGSSIPQNPVTVELLQNFPNPFNPHTTITVDIEKRSLVELCVFDLRGKKVTTLARKIMDKGHHRLTWEGKTDDGTRLLSGVYFCRLVSGRQKLTRKMLLLEKGDHFRVGNDTGSRPRKWAQKLNMT